jgi:hypothetical protein
MTIKYGLQFFFWPPNLGNTARYLTLWVKGAAISRTMSTISSGVREKSGGVWEKCADTVNLFFSQFL